MKNVTLNISVKGLAEQTMQVPTEVAVEIFLRTSRIIASTITRYNKSKTDCNSKQEIDLVKVLEENKSVMNEDYEDPISTKIGNDVVDHYERKPTGEIGSKDKTYSLDEIETMVNKTDDNPFNHAMFASEKLVAFRCPTCGEVTVRRTSLGQSNIMKCHFCKAKFPILKVVYGEILCPNCSCMSRMYLADGLTEVKCRHCESPIDIIYYQDGPKTKIRTNDRQDK